MAGLQGPMGLGEREELMDSALNDAYDHILFRSIVRGDSPEEEQRKSRDNAISAIACELHKIRKLMENGQEEEPSFSKTFLKVRDLRREKEAEEKKGDHVSMSSQLFIRLAFGEDATIANIKQSLAAMQRLTELLQKGWIIRYACYTTSQLFSIVTALPKLAPDWYKKWAMEDRHRSYSGYGETFADAILNLKVEK